MSLILMKLISKSNVNSLDICLSIWFYLILSLNIVKTNADIDVISASNLTVEVFDDLELGFAAPVPSDGILGRLVLTEPEDGCSPMKPPPQSNQTGIKWFALVKRYPCQFTTKVQNAMDAGFDAVIIYNIDITNTDNKVSLVNSAQQLENVFNISALLISFDDGWTLKKDYVWDKGYSVLILPDPPVPSPAPALNAYLLPFAIVIGVCLLLMISFMIVKCIRGRKGRLGHRLYSRNLKQIPIQKFKKGIENYGLIQNE